MNLTVFDSAQAIAENITARIKKLLTETDGKISLAISGGNTPTTLFKYWIEQCIESIDWKRILFFWVDERCVSTTSLESNYGKAKRIFFDKLPSLSENIYFINGENLPELEAAFQSERLLQTVARNNGIPQFDLILLGMGNDGHTASIFPNQMTLLVSGKFYDVGIHPHTNQNRITLTGSVINNAKNVLFMVTGSDKAKIFNDIRYHQNGWITYPASHIKPVGYLEWLVDVDVLKRD